jgi:hypothetical protein
MFQSTKLFRPLPIAPKMKHILFLLAAICSVSYSNAAVLLEVGQSGAAKNVNTTSSPLTWSFTWNGGNLQFNSAGFNGGRDSGTPAGDKLIMTLYSVVGGNATSVLSSFLTAADVSQGFNNLSFTFTPQTLAAGNYFVQLTSTASAGNDFNVKVGALQLFDVNENTKTELDSSFYTTDGNTDGTSSAALIPEPSALLLSALGALALLRRKRA